MATMRKNPGKARSVSGLAPGARQLPALHVSIRVPWHDAGWDGSVCRHPRENTSCLVLKNIAAKKDDSAEERVAAKRLPSLSQAELPACAAERGFFMSPDGLVRSIVHAYAWSKTHAHFEPTPFTEPAYSAAAIPFRWVMRSAVEGGDDEVGLAERHGIDYQPDREPDLGFDTGWVQGAENQHALFDTFFSAVRPEVSLCFLYAKRTPLTEDNRRVIVGVARVTHVGQAAEYRYSRPGLRAMLWERSVGHSLRPDLGDGILFPYQAILDAAAKDASIRPEDYVALVPDERRAEFSYVTEHVSHDTAIGALLACAAALRRIGGVVPGPWDRALTWIDRELNRLWTMRGPFPGLGSALTALGLERGNLIAYSIAAAQARSGSEWNEDPWPLFEQALEEPALLGDDVAADLGGTWPRVWKKLGAERKALLRLLSRFALSAPQAVCFFQAEEREKVGIEVSDGDLLANPYLLYELDRASLDPIALETVDRGMFPDAVVRDRHPMPAPSAPADAADPRRVRAFVVEALERAAANGDTLLPRDRVIRSVQAREVRPALPGNADVLAVAEETFGGTVRTVALADGAPAYQLERLATLRELIVSAVERRCRGKRHEKAIDWRARLDEDLDRQPGQADDSVHEDAARQEKAAALAELFASRVSVLVGPAGTGKTTLLRILCSAPEVERGGVLLLAPTGKARVRLEEQTGLKGGKTIAQLLLRLGRYDPGTGAYTATGDAKKEQDHKTVVVDECSMLTEDQLGALLDALAGVERLILVGDPRQLPPIGAGRPFVDIVRRLAPEKVESRFPRVGPGYAELTVMRRQKGGERADLALARWFGGRPLDAGADEIWDRVQAGRSEHLALVRWETPEELESKLVAALVAELPLEGPDDEQGFSVSLGAVRNGEYAYFSSRWVKNGSVINEGTARAAHAWQVLSPVRAGLHGVDSLNRSLQARFRAGILRMAEDRYGRRVCRPMGPHGIVYGDKVISVVNGKRYDCFPKREDTYVANGDLGVCVGQLKTKRSKFEKPWKLEVELSAQPGFKYGYTERDFDEERGAALELAYALTIHKAQGSQFGKTFVVLPQPCWLLSRELLYTCLTRQEQKVVVFHQGELRELRRYASEHQSETARRLTNLFQAPRLVEIEERFLDEGLIHRTARNELVRSKSEVIVADLLGGMGVDYRYEQPLEGKGGSVRYPDFTVDDAETGNTVYIEHLGMRGHAEYEARWQRKLAWYREMGVTPESEGGGPAGTLVTTEDGRDGSIDVPAIKAVLRRALGRT